MYETAFHVAALRKSGIARIRDLEGKRVGTGPANGPAEGYFRGLAEVSGIKPVIVAGAPAEMVKQLIAGDIDALWQGAVIPIPSLLDVQKQADAVVFGLTVDEVNLLRKRFPLMSASTTPPGRYAGQLAPLLSIAAWNFVIAHRELPETLAHTLTRTVLSAPDLVASVGLAAAGTRAANAVNNTIVPFHPGALRALRDLGVEIKG